MLGLGYRRELLLPGVNVFYCVGNYRKLVKRLACVPLQPRSSCAPSALCGMLMMGASGSA